MSTVALWCLVLSGPIAAQTTGVLTGVVRDQSGAVVPEVRLTAIKVDTGLQRFSLSQADGRYVFPSVPVGPYTLRAEKPGFHVFEKGGFRLAIGETLVVDLDLEVGGAEEKVTVTGEIPRVNTGTSELSYLVTEQNIRELPLNGRNYTDLVFLQPGVVAYPHRDGGSVVAHGLGASINGQDPRSNVYLLDGTLQNDFTNGPAGSAAGTSLGMETIREFRVESNAYSAEFGRNSGGQINALTKSGSNLLHGSAYYFHRNDNLDARNFFDPSTQPEFRRHQFGGTVGGPVRRDKAFFFIGYEGLREELGRSLSTLVPDEKARLGQLPDPANPGGTINVGVNPAVRPYLDEYPLPNGPNLGGGIATHYFGFRQGIDQNFFQARYDQNVGDRHQYFVRYTHDRAEQRLPTDFPQFPRAFASRNQFLTAEHRQIFSPTTLHTLRFSFSRTRIGQNVESNTTQQLQPFVPSRGLVGNIDIGGLPRFGPQTSVNVTLIQNLFGVEYGLDHTRGKHLLKFGGLAERYQDNLYNPTFALGIYTFSNLRSFLENRPLRYLGLTPDGALDRYWRFTLLSMYVQDNYRIHPRLTLNMGLRYEYATLPRDIYGRDAVLVKLSDPQPTLGQPYQNPTGKNLSPRVGFAWDLFGKGTTSLRGGYGQFFNTNNQQNLIVTITNPPFTPRMIISNPTFPSPPFDRGVGNSIRPVQWDLKNPNLHVWNLSFQHQMWSNIVLTLGYSGSRGVHLLRNSDVNIPTPTQLADGTYFFPATARRPNPNFSTIEYKSSDGDSWYNAMIVELRHRWEHGFDFQSSYTFSRNIDTTQASTFFSDATNGTTSAMPDYPGLNYNRGLADYHAQHNWVTNLLWDIPFASGLTGIAGKLLDGWQLASIIQMRSGSPLTLFVQRNRSRSQWSPSLGPGLGFDRPNLAPGRTHQDAVRGGPNQYFDPSAFALQPAGTLGSLGRGALIGPDLRVWDLAAVKNFRWSKLGEEGRIQFRLEAFNVLNRANFGVPSLLAFAGDTDNEKPLTSLGLIRYTVTSSRQIQVGLRIAF